MLRVRRYGFCVFECFPAGFAGALCHLDYALEAFPIGFASARGEGIEVHGEEEVGVEIEYGGELAFLMRECEHEGFVLAVDEVDFRVFEVEEGGGVAAVVDRSYALHLKVAADVSVLGVFFYGEEHPAFYFFIGGELCVAEHGGVHILRDGLLKCLEHLFVGSFDLVGVYLDGAVEFLCGDVSAQRRERKQPYYYACECAHCSISLRMSAATAALLLRW